MKCTSPRARELMWCAHAGKWMITYLAGRGAGFLGVDELASDNAQVMAYFACTARACPDVIHGGRQHWMSEYLAPHDTSDAGVGLRRSVSVASTPRASPTASDGAASGTYRTRSPCCYRPIL